MKIVFSFILFLTLLIGTAHAAGPLDLLSTEDRATFEAAYKICQTGSAGSALRLGFDLEIFSENLINGLQIASLDLDSLKLRMKNNGLSPALYRVRHSPGFMLAMTQCYGYRYGELNYGNLMKQLIEMGQIASLVTAGAISVGSVITGANLTKGVATQFPIASRFVVSALVSLQLYAVFNGLKDLLWVDHSEQAQDQREKTKAAIFKEPDQAILEIKRAAQIKLNEINQTLLTENLDSAHRAQLEQKKVRIQKAITELENLKS